MKVDVYGERDLRNHIASYCGEYEIEFHCPGSAEHYAAELARGLLAGAKYVAKHGAVFDDFVSSFHSDKRKV